MGDTTYDKAKVLAILNKILESELAGAVRYTHYSFMVFGFTRIPIVSWFRAHANENMQHAQQAGEMITHLGGHPSLGIGELLETHKHSIDQILRETLQTEHQTLQMYHQLFEAVEGRSVLLEEYAREMIRAEETHIGEIDKMLRKPGDVGVSEDGKGLLS